jgi:hypothetical protein
MAELTVTSDYKCSPDNGNLKFPNGTTLSVNPPSNGCCLCFSVAVNGQQSYGFPNTTKTDIPFSGFSNGAVITYTAGAYADPCTCPDSPVATVTHTITIDTSMG